MTTTDTVSDEATFAALAALPDDEPVVMLNLLEFAGDGGESYAKYGRVALPQIVKRGGKILYNGTPLRDDPTAAGLVAAMIAAPDAAPTPGLRAETEASGLTLHQALTLAAIV